MVICGFDLGQKCVYKILTHLVSTWSRVQIRTSTMSLVVSHDQDMSCAYMVCAHFWYTLDLDIHTCECHGPSLDLVMTFVVDSRSIRGLSSWTRLVTVAENNSGTLRTCVETWTFFICRADSWLELVVVSHDQIMSWTCFCGFGLNSDACAYMCLCTSFDQFRSGHTYLWMSRS